ncbi:TPA: hypothetical protein PBT85_002521 [Staphylococcus aureus]|nr:hypothetical protein [Staphylococcus aureus]
MLKVNTPNYEINNKKDFTFQEMIKITENLEDGKYPNAQNEFTYILYDDGDKQEILEAEYKAFEGNVNIYRHAKETLSNIEVSDKEMKKIKHTILKQLDDEATIYRKTEEQKLKQQAKNENKPKYQPNTHYQQNNKNKFSKENIIPFLKTGKGIGLIALIIIAIAMMFYLYSTMDNQKKGKDTITKEDIYKQALLNREDEAIKNFSRLKKEDMDAQDKNIYANLLIDKGDFEKAQDVKSTKYVENTLFEQNKVDELKKFNEKYPTNNGKFDDKYFDEKYNDAIKLIDGVDKTNKRKYAIAKTYIETDNLEKAKKLSTTTNNNDITKLITEKESELAKEKEKELSKKEKEYEKVENDSKKKKEAKTLKKEIDSLEDEIKDLKNETD